MNRRRMVVAVTSVVLVINDFGVLGQTSGGVFALGTLTISGVAMLWLIGLVRRRA